MNKLLTTATASLLAAAASAQVATNYVFSQSLGVYTPVVGTVLGTATSANTLDDLTYVVPLPFVFNYDGLPQTSVVVQTNGHIAFGSTQITTNYTPLSSTNVTPGYVAAVGRDLQGGYNVACTRTLGSITVTGVAAMGPLAVGDTLVGTGIPAGTTIVAIGAGTFDMSAAATATSAGTAVQAYGPQYNLQWALEGVTPNQEFVVQWSNFRRWSTSLATSNANRFNFQIRLHENGSIRCVYGDCSPGVGTTSTSIHQVGLRGPTNVFATNVNNRRSVKPTSDWNTSVVGTTNAEGHLCNTVAPANVITSGLEYLWTYVPPPCAGTPAPGNVTGAPALACIGNSYTLGLQNATSGAGVTYQWWSSPDNATWAALGTGPTQVVSQSTTMYYYCDVTCTVSGMTGTTTTLQLDMDSAVNPQNFEAGFTGCWTNSGGGVSPDLRPVSGFGLGAQAVRFAFDGWGSAGNGQTGLVTSPLLSTNPGDMLFFDAAGATWPGFGPDTITVEESLDGGVTWSTIVTGNNNVGGLWNTGGSVAAAFVPTAAQWKVLSYPLSIGANRVRFRSVSGWGNDCFIDNVVVGPAGYARHLPYGVACVPGYEITASPAPTPSTLVTYTANNIPQWVSVPVYGSALALGFVADVPGTDLLTASFGTFDSPCLAHLTLAGLVDVVFLPNNLPNDTWNFTIPPLCPLGAQLFVQGVAQTDYVFPTNPSGLVTSRALETYVGAF